MTKAELRQKFFDELSRLRKLPFKVVCDEGTIEYKAIINELVFKNLPEKDRLELLKSAKAHKLSIPPPIIFMANFESAYQQIISITTLMEISNNWNEFRELNKKLETNRASQPAAQNTNDNLSDFDRILFGIMSVPKSEIEKSEKDGKRK